MQTNSNDFMEEHPYYLKVLKKGFDELNTKLGKTSIRQFALLLDTDPGVTCRLLSGKHIPTLKLGIRLAVHLKLQAEETEQFLFSVIEAQSRSLISKVHQITRSQTNVETTENSK